MAYVLANHGGGDVTHTHTHASEHKDIGVRCVDGCIETHVSTWHRCFVSVSIGV